MTRTAGRILLETVVVVVVGLALGLTANAMNTDGLRIGRDYFAPLRAKPVPASARVVESEAVETAPNSPKSAPAAHEDTSSSPEAVPPAGSSDARSATSGPVTPPGAPRYDEEGYQLISHEEAVAAYQSDQYLAELYVFIDARDDTHYLDGHIPGAYQLFPYQIERYIEPVLPACQQAEKIIVYCNGGKCVDSKLAAGELMNNGIDPSKIYVYTGGSEAWQADGLPMEQGERLSGDIVYPPVE